MKRVVASDDAKELRKLVGNPDRSTSNGDVILRAASALRSKAKVEQALALVRRALRSRRDLSRRAVILLCHLQAECLLDKRRFAAAIIVYGSILSRVADPKAYANRGLANWESKKYRAALDDYSKAAAMDPKDAVVQRSIGELQNRLGCSANAAKHLEKAVRLDPSSARSFCALGIAYYNMRSWVKAYRSLRRAVQIDTNNRIAMLGLKKIEDHFEL